MIYILNGRRYKINDLDPALDAMFAQLHAAYLGPNPIALGSVSNGCSSFQRADRHHVFLDITLTLIILLIYGINFSQLVGTMMPKSLWQLALAPALESESQNPGHKIHKGTAYYYWAITAILRGDIDKGYALMHQALEEDIATTGQKFPDSARLCISRPSKLGEAGPKPLDNG